MRRSVTQTPKGALEKHATQRHQLEFHGQTSTHHCVPASHLRHSISKPDIGFMNHTNTINQYYTAHMMFIIQLTGFTVLDASKVIIIMFEHCAFLAVFLRLGVTVRPLKQLVVTA